MSKTDEKAAPAERILNEAEVVKMVGVSRVTIYTWERDGRFPRRRQLGPKRVGWLLSDILNWMQKLPPA